MPLSSVKRLANRARTSYLHPYQYTHIMSCTFTINHSGNKLTLVDNLRAAILQVNGTFEGDESEGVFRGQTPLGGFSGRYNVSGDDITVVIDDKPFLVGCSRIEKEIRQYLERHP